MLAAAMHVLCIAHVFNAGRSKIQAVAGPKSRCFGPDPVLDFARLRTGTNRYIKNFFTHPLLIGTLHALHMHAFILHRHWK